MIHIYVTNHYTIKAKRTHRPRFQAFQQKGMKCKRHKTNPEDIEREISNTNHHHQKSQVKSYIHDQVLVLGLYDSNFYFHPKIHS